MKGGVEHSGEALDAPSHRSVRQIKFRLDLANARVEP
jgi:hypothetical protein